ncbi:MAG: polyphosphate kinase 1 [Candidatus Sericytochromatia bacterium]
MEPQFEHFKAREISWLSFNERVLQEVLSPQTPLLERLRFLGIFSSNLDEFFQVRVAVLQRLQRLGLAQLPLTGESPQEVLEQIAKIALQQQSRFESAYQFVLRELARHGIEIVDETQLTPEQARFVGRYFSEQVRPNLVPIMLEQLERFAGRDKSLYLAVQMSAAGRKPGHALIELPTDRLPRFVVLPSEPHREVILLLDDLVRYLLPEVFNTLNYTDYAAYTIKLTRDAELDLNDVEEADFASYVDKLAQSLKKRARAIPVRMVYDQNLPDDFLQLLRRKLDLRQGATLLPGGRYQNFKDFIHFPRLGPAEYFYPKLAPVPLSDDGPSLFKRLSKHDILLFYPYHSFDHFLDLLREAAIDPSVESIQITLYRVGQQSRIVNALVNAARNGKQVHVVLELLASFDEEANINWAEYLLSEGVDVIYGVTGYKIHAKLCLITRRSGQRSSAFGVIGTGNFNEDTAQSYTDLSLMTARPELTADIAEVFRFFADPVPRREWRHLLVSPLTLRSGLQAMITREIANAESGQPAWIVAKINSLVDKDLIEWLYRASQAGVKIFLLVRGMCSLRTGIRGLSRNIQAFSLVDRYLEHSRVMVFANGDAPSYWIGSADWMTRNLDRRMEVMCPIEDPALQRQLRVLLKLHLADNTKARILDSQQTNAMRKTGPRTPKLRAQVAFHDWLLMGTMPELPPTPMPTSWEGDD